MSEEEQRIRYPEGDLVKNTGDWGAPYKGFLIIRCPKCGNQQTFCARQPVFTWKCKRCGNVVELDDVKPVYLRCKCGNTSKYRTNIQDGEITTTCINCKTPVTMELNRRGTAFITKKVQ